ncbi:MAG: ATP-dependent Clp protease proteolytic subunit [Planctomycetota bacterium]
MFKHIASAGALSACLLAPPAIVSAAQDATEVADAQAAPEKSGVQLMKEELDRLNTEYQLMKQRQKMELAQAELERTEIASKSALREARLRDELAASRASAERAQAEAELIRARAALEAAKQSQELAAMRAMIERRSVERQMADAKTREGLEETRLDALESEARANLARSAFAEAKARYDTMTLELREQLAELQRDLDVRKKKDEIAGMVTDDIVYHDEPFRDGTLYVSDRRIPLNGAISWGTGSYVADRIQFFNNQCEDKPIFIVIDSSPGGSVMEGYRVLKAMDASRAPIHVVVKSFAASMAATITTLADHSYVFPNAIMLHHQMSSGMRGNMTQQQESLENSLEWQRRLAKPIADKMGVSLDRFVELMYENNSDGDWEEFAQEAVELNWADHIVTELRETGLRNRPGTGDAGPGFTAQMRTDENGRKYIELPPLQPFDHYFMYDPYNFYRVAR